MSPASIRILHLVPSIGNIWGGVANLVADLVLAQRHQGHFPIIHCTDDRAGLAQATLLRPIDELVKTSPRRGPASIYFSPGGEAWARSKAASGFDIAHQHAIWTPFSRVTLAWAQSHGGPVIISPQGSLDPCALVYSTWKKRLAFWAYERANLARADCLQATTEGEIETFRRFGLRNPVAIIPNGITEGWIHAPSDPASFRASAQLPPKARVMLFLSRIHHKKGLHLLLEALHKLGDRLGEWHLVVAGPVENERYRRLIDTQVRSQQIASKVTFTGPLYGSQKRNAYAAAELFVLPTLSDNFAITVAEALGAGIPVLTTTSAMAWQNLEKAGCGWRSEPRADAIAQALEHVLSLPSRELRQLGDRGKRYVKQYYLWDSIAEKSSHLYRWLLGRSEKPSFVYYD